MKPSKQRSINQARQLLRNCELGVLSTHSKACDGFPFGSVSTFMSTHERDIVFYISDLAQHTKNIQNKPEMSFTVFPGCSSKGNQPDDPNAGARLSLIGSAQMMSEDQQEAISERFFMLYPDSRKYQKAHSFNFFKMTIERARYIGGFGDIHWFSDQEWRLETPSWCESELDMVTHMNDDHVDAMMAICQWKAGINSESVEMLAINPDGAFYRCQHHDAIFIEFDELAYDGNSVRQLLVKQTQEARQKLGLTKTLAKTLATT